MLARSRISFHCLGSSSFTAKHSATSFSRFVAAASPKTTTTTTLAATASSNSISSSPLMLTSRRFMTEIHSNAETNASRRDQEAFLAQYNPMEELGLYEGVHDLRQIERAYQNKKKEYAGDKVHTDRVERAFNCITDPKSPYYERLTWQQGYRQRLLVELLPNDQRRMAKAYAYFWGSVGFIFLLVAVYSFIHPVVKIWRAATR